MKRLLIAFTILAIGITSFAQMVNAQDDERRSELGERQRLVQRKMQELEGKIIVIAEKIAQKEPERAARLKATLDQAKERLIVKRMEKISEYLDARQYDKAEAEINAVVTDLEELVRLLLNDQRDKMTKKEEIDFLQKAKEEIKKILKEQKELTKENEKVSNKDKTLKDLDEKIKAVKDLIKDQEEVIRQTEDNAEAGIRALDRVADKQYDTRKKTEDLAKELGDEDEEPEDKPSDSKPSDSKPSDSKPSDS